MSLEVTKRIQVKCQGPKCHSYNETICPATLSWEQTEPPTENELDQIPDGAYRIITIAPFVGPPAMFLSAQCAKDYLRIYTPPMSPREITKIAQANQAVEEKKNPIPAQPTESIVPGSTATPEAFVASQL